MGKKTLYRTGCVRRALLAFRPSTVFFIFGQMVFLAYFLTSFSTYFLIRKLTVAVARYVSFSNDVFFDSEE